MISLITGIPGSGKSYRAVYEINKILQENEKIFLIVSNIEGLNIEDNRLIHQDIDNKEFFYKDIFQKYINDLRERYKLCVSDMIYFYIDEPQRFLPPRLADEKVFASFEMHRHYGVDIYLITQDKRKIPLPISCLIENEVRAVNPKFGIVPSCFNYNHFCGDYITGKSVLKKDRKIFKLYQSFVGGTPKKYRNSYVLILFFLIIFLVVITYFFIGSFETKDNPRPPAPVRAPSSVPADTASLRPPAPAPTRAPVRVPSPAPVPVTAPDLNSDSAIEEAEELPIPFITILDVNFTSAFFRCDIYGNIIRISFRDFFRTYSPSIYRYSYILSETFLFLNVDGALYNLNKKSRLHEAIVLEQRIHTTDGQPKKLFTQVLSHDLEKEIFREYLKE